MAADIREITRAGAAIVLSLNVDKCELITHPGERRPSSVVQDGGALLGAPLFVGAALDSAWENRCEDLARTCDRLRLIGAQDAIILLHSSFSAPQVLHLLRCRSSANHQALSNIDAILIRVIQLINNTNL